MYELYIMYMYRYNVYVFVHSLKSNNEYTVNE